MNASLALKSRIFLGIAACAAATASSRSASAAPRETATLRYAPAPGCPDEDGFRHRVAARLGYDPFVASAARVIDVKITTSGKRLTATTVLHLPGKSDSVRKLDEAADHCDALTDTVAASVATVVDPVRAGAAPAAAADPPAKEKEEVVKVSTEPGAAGAMTRLHLDSDLAGSEIQRKLGTSYGSGTVNGKYATVTVLHFERVCRAPCVADVPTEGEYYVDAPGMAPRKFAIPPNAKRLDAHVKSAPAWPLALALYGGVGVGATLAITGGVLLAVSDSSAAVPMTVVGVLLLAGGITALVLLPKTHVESADGARLDASAKPQKSVQLTAQGLVF